MLDSRSNFLFASTKRKDGGELYQKLKEKGILVRHFDAPRIANWLRITIGTPEQMQTLLEKLDEVLSDRVHTIRVLLPYDKLGLAAPMRERGSVQVEEYREDGLYLEGIVKTEDLHCFEGYLV